MKELKIFLKVLEELKGKMFIDKLTITPQKPMTAYKKYVLEVWSIENKDKQLMSSVELIDKSTTEAQDSSIKEHITRETIKVILKYYGL